ncbi:MAG: hypothetical protein R3B45_12195 [Bdellovibrionota bacterium]
MKVFANVFLAALIMLPAFSAQAEKKVAMKKKTNWCCMLDEKPVMSTGKKAKKLCVKSETEPTAESKAKMVKKFVTQCTEAGGAWQQQ